jgi:hypothetical protein
VRGLCLFLSFTTYMILLHDISRRK